MSVNERLEGDVAVLAIAGKITIGLGDVELRNAVRQALKDGHEKILLEMSGVTALDSSGVGELVSAYSSASTRGADLRLACLSPKVSTVLQVTRLFGIFEIYSSEEEALVAFATR